MVVIVGRGVTVGRGVAVGVSVSVGTGVAVGTGVFVGVGLGVSVGTGVDVGKGVGVGAGAHATTRATTNTETKSKVKRLIASLPSLILSSCDEEILLGYEGMAQNAISTTTGGRLSNYTLVSILKLVTLIGINHHWQMRLEVLIHV